MTGDGAVTFTSVRFTNFKALVNFSVSLESFNILVGENNSGKSTVISAFRALEIALRKARARKAERVPAPGKSSEWGWNITSSDLPITLENVHTDYEEAESSIVFRLSNGTVLHLHFPRDGGCFLLIENREFLRTPARVRREVPVDIGVVPVLGPVEHEEKVLTEETVRQGLATHRASTHFRNYWRLNPDGFKQFASLIQKTWPGMTIEPPEVVDLMDQKLAMFCNEERMPRELAWAGFGFQIWCQLLTHLLRSQEAAILVVDEPEVYLHPDLQRKLMEILRTLGPEILLTTHSTEIMGEAEPSDMLLVDKAKRSAERLKNVEAVQGAIEQIGSVHNVTLTQLARTRRVLYVEGKEDFKRLRRFAGTLGLESLASGLDVTPVKSGGFGRWKEIYSSAWGIENALGTPLKMGAVFDSDFWPAGEIDEMVEKLKERLRFVWVLGRKELENYFLEPAVLDRALTRWIADRARRTDSDAPEARPIEELLEEATAPLRDEAQAQYVARKLEYLERTNADGGKDSSTRTREALEWFSDHWDSLDERLKVVPGKAALANLRGIVQAAYGVSLTDVRIIGEFREDEIPSDLKDLLMALDGFRQT